jgi:hypothetical protein
MDKVAFLIGIISAVFLFWLLKAFYQLGIACWKPGRAKEKWLVVVNAHDGLFFNFYKWAIPAVAASLLVQFLLVVARVVVEIMHELQG